jgi:hypothetical protein
MVFDNPYLVPFRITRLEVSGDVLTLRWDAQAGRRYTVEWSPDLNGWRTAASGILVGGTQGLWNAALPRGSRFYRVFQEAVP